MLHQSVHHGGDAPQELLAIVLRYLYSTDWVLSLIHILHEDYIKARRSWIAAIRKDAEKEFAMGDVEEEVFRNFVDSLDQEIEMCIRDRSRADHSIYNRLVRALQLRLVLL